MRLQDYSDLNVGLGRKLIAERQSADQRHLPPGRRLRCRHAGRARSGAGPRHRLRALRTVSRQCADRPFARRAGQRHAARQPAHLHQPALASAAGNDRAQPDLASRRPGLGDAAAHARRDGPAGRRRPASRRSTSASTSGASSPSRSHGASETMAAPATDPASGPAREPYSGIVLRAALWLALLAPFFYSTYGFANWLASRRDHVGSIVFAWEHAIPFVAWTIVPYWSINLFYGLSLLLNDDQARRRPPRRPLPHGADRRRLLLHRVSADGDFRAAGNQRPAGLPVRGARRLRQAVQPGAVAAHRAAGDHLGPLASRSGAPPSRRHSGPVWHVWCFLIGASVLTTWQHHFIDIPTGALLGLFALWLFPAKGELPFAGFRLTADPKARRLARLLCAGRGACLGRRCRRRVRLRRLAHPAVAGAGAGHRRLRLCRGRRRKCSRKRPTAASRWPAVSCSCPTGLAPGSMSGHGPASLRRRSQIADGVFLGRFPTAAEANRFGTVIDLAGELERPRGATCRWISLRHARPRGAAARQAASEPWRRSSWRAGAARCWSAARSASSAVRPSSPTGWL